MTPAQIAEVVTFYLNSFTAPLFRVASQASLEKYIDIAGKLIESNLNIVFGVASFSMTKELRGSTNIIDVDNTPLLSVSAITFEGEDINIPDDYPYELFRAHITFLDALGEGSFAMTYSAGLVFNEDVKNAISLQVNHLVETKMINSERIGIITMRPDRAVIPREVKIYLGISDMGVSIL